MNSYGTYDEWFFISVAEIIDVPVTSRAIGKIIDKPMELLGCFVIKYYIGNACGLYVFLMSKIIGQCTVKEIECF